MTNINNNLKNEMAIVSSLILDEAKNGKKIHLVTVDERKDSSAFTDGSSIIQVPVNFGNVTPQLRSVAYGFLSHEASHCRNTDFTVIRKLVETFCNSLANASTLTQPKSMLLLKDGGLGQTHKGSVGRNVFSHTPYIGATYV